jgi:hypothetical protein
LPPRHKQTTRRACAWRTCEEHELHVVIFVRLRCCSCMTSSHVGMFPILMHARSANCVADAAGKVMLLVAVIDLSAMTACVLMTDECTAGSSVSLGKVSILKQCEWHRSIGAASGRLAMGGAAGPLSKRKWLTDSTRCAQAHWPAEWSIQSLTRRSRHSLRHCALLQLKFIAVAVGRVHEAHNLVWRPG